MNFFAKYILFLLFFSSFLSEMVIAMQDPEYNEKNVYQLTKSFKPSVGTTISPTKEGYPDYKKPKGILCLDPEGQMYFYKDVISLTCQNVEKSYLAVNGTVSKNSYQWAFFGTKEYLDNDPQAYSSTFTLIPEKDSYRIQCNFGEKSYLAVNGTVSKNSYQWAFFGTKEYLDSDPKTYPSNILGEFPR